jgi:hypothetical protein
MENDEVGSVCGTRESQERERELFAGFWLENLKERDQQKKYTYMQE